MRAKNKARRNMREVEMEKLRTRIDGNEEIRGKQRWRRREETKRYKDGEER